VTTPSPSSTNHVVGTADRFGKLYLIPTHLSAANAQATVAVLPQTVINIAGTLTHYIAENAKSARGFLKALGVEKPIADFTIVELDKHEQTADVQHLLAPLLSGIDVGLVSEAGAPAVADPGALVVAAAHEAGIRVIPLVGPSSILLALMASGLNGQVFAFHGYLPHDKAERVRVLQQLEKESKQRAMTQIFIETPYRNQSAAADLLAVLSAPTRLCVATDLTGAQELIQMRPIAEWRKAPPALAKLPSLFLFLA
jgi:16S rRNA (cytidine1402-2'-O)-methyltransferase